MSKKVVTRFAPSPTGFLHIGSIRTALYNYLYAKQNGGIFYLRIEDTDQKRFVQQAEDYIKSALEWCGISPDFAPWSPGDGEFSKLRQSERNYTKYVSSLLDSGKAYIAFDTEQELTNARYNFKNFAYNASTRMQMRNTLTMSKNEARDLIDSGAKYVVRFKVPENCDITFTDIVRGKVTINTSEIDDKVLVKSDGIPTYHLANVCDDADMQTTHVIRGEEWLSSTPLHILLYHAIEKPTPQFAHLPSILRPDGKGKISKRDSLKYGMPVFPFGGEATDEKGKIVSYKGFREEGFEPNALLNFLFLLGWSPSTAKEIFTLDDMIQDFSLDKVNKAGARFDYEKAKWFNSAWVQKISLEESIQYVGLSDNNLYDLKKKTAIIDLAKKRSVFRKDMSIIADIFVKSPTVDNSKATDDFKSVFSSFNSVMDADEWQPDTIKKNLNEICNQHSVKLNKLMPQLRLCLTGGIPGPDLITTMWILGRGETMQRLAVFTK